MCVFVGVLKVISGISGVLTLAPSSSFSSSIDQISGLGNLQLCGRLALKLLARPRPLPRSGESLTLARPRVEEDQLSGMVIPSPVGMWCLTVREDFRGGEEGEVYFFVKSLRVRGISRARSSSSSSSMGGSGTLWREDGETSRMMGSLELELSMPAE